MSTSFSSEWRSMLSRNSWSPYILPRPAQYNKQIYQMYKNMKSTCCWNKKSAKKLNIHQWKKHSEETQTLHASCGKAEPKFFAAPQTPFPGVRDGQNLISWRWSLPSPTNPVWWGSMHAISNYRGNRPTHKHTDRTDYNTLCRSLAQCN